MLNFKSMHKTKLSLALSAVLAGGMLSAPAQAVQVSGDGLGDAALFQYYSAKSTWQTFFRIINTSNEAVLIKVRFREAANSREVLDFVVALSPNDMWAAWTDANALNGKPGVKTNDASCIFDKPNTGLTTFQSIGGGVKAAAFSDLAITNDYDDKGPAVADRLKEGHFEVIGISSHPAASDIARAVTHSDNGKPNDCNEGFRLLENYIASPDFFDSFAGDVGNVLAANAQLINVATGEGAGYDPTILANFRSDQVDRDNNGLTTAGEELLVETLRTDLANGPKPDMDSADPVSVVLRNDGVAISSVWDANDNGVADQQLLANGSVAVIPRNVGDIAANPAAIDGIPDPGNTITIRNSTGSLIAAGVDETNIPQSVVNAMVGNKLTPCVGFVAALGDTVCLQVVSSTTGAPAYTASVSAQNTLAASDTVRDAARRTNLPNAPVTGGVDAVSAVLAADSVINEWAAFRNPTGFIKDYFTQWVLNFPTKHYYVDIQDDVDRSDLIAPTLWDPRGDTPTDINDAFAPFSNEFNITGKSCEPYYLALWDTEESDAGFNSPREYEPSELCYETNVLSFGDGFDAQGLASGFSAVAPQSELPPNEMLNDAGFVAAQYGWARLNFRGAGANTGLTSNWSAIGDYTYAFDGDGEGFDIDRGFTSEGQAIVNYGGLPVHGFVLQSYGTGSVDTNHNAINDHKYERDISINPRLLF